MKQIERHLSTVADRIVERMGPLFGSPEYLADPVKRARSEKRQREAAESYARIALEACADHIDALEARVGEYELENHGLRHNCGEYVNQRDRFKQEAHNAALDASKQALRAEAAERALADAVEVLKRCLNFIENTEGEMGEPLSCGDAARAFIAKMGEK